MARAKKDGRKGRPTRKQRAARAKFSKGIARAKALQKKNPKMTWKAALKKAF